MNEDEIINGDYPSCPFVACLNPGTEWIEFAFYRTISGMKLRVCPKHKVLVTKMIAPRLLA